MTGILDNLIDSLRGPSEISIEFSDETPNRRDASGNLLPLENLTNTITNTLRNLNFNTRNNRNNRNNRNSITAINENSNLVSIQDNNWERYGHEKCSICDTAYQQGDIIREFDKCTHFFHYSCIDTWLHTHKNCPYCNTELV